MQSVGPKMDQGENVRTRWLIMIGVALGISWGIAESAAAAEVDSAITGAMDDFRQGRCEQAYGRLAGLDGLEHRARLLAGQCHIRAGLYPDALADLDPARGGSDLDPGQLADVELYRAIALYHLERFGEASAALDQADGSTSEEGQLALYRGLIALRNGDHDRAAPALESAARLSPATTEPVASYYAGLAWQSASERSKARAAFQRVVDIDAAGVWGKEAAKLLESTELFPYFVRGSVGIEYDDNVILRGGVTQFSQLGSPLQIVTDGQKDWRGVWRIEAGVQLFNIDDWSGGVTGGYSGSAHYDLTEFDTHFPTVGAFLARRFDANTTGQIRYQFGFAWVDEDSFLQAHSTEIGLSHTWPKAGTTIVVADFLWNDLRFPRQDVLDGPGDGGPCANPPLELGCGPSGLNERRERDRDGIGIGAAFEHRVPLRVPRAIEGVFEQIEISAGYRFRYYDSKGTEWKHFAHIVSLGIEFEFPFDFSLSTRASYEFRDFSDPSTYPDSEIANEEYTLSSVDREEHEVSVEAEIAKHLTENLSLSMRWSYLDNESNRRVYDYSRHIVGGYLNFRFD